MSILLPLLRLSGRVDQAPTASDFDGVSGFLRRHVALGFASRAADDLFVEDVVTFTMDKATMGSSGFRGSTEGEAITFLRRVASNRAIDLIRKAERRASAEERRPPPEVMAAESFELKAADLERIFGGTRHSHLRTSPEAAALHQTPMQACATPGSPTSASSCTVIPRIKLVERV